ncbi:MAG: tetratricopeptide repeat protein [Moraxellaceae bacterium]
MKILLPLSFLLLVACASQSQQEASARKNSSACSSALSNEQEFTLNMVEQREKDGQLYAALAALESLPEREPAVMQHKADVLRRLGRPESADYFRRLQKSCLSAWGDHGLGLLAAEAGDLKTAQKLLQQAATALPTEYRLRNDLGVLLLRQQKIDEARFELMTALELSSDRSLPSVNLLTLLMVQQKPVAMRSLMQRYKMAGPEWQAAVQSCESLVADWQKQGIAHQASEKICTVPSPVEFPVVARTGETG